MKLEHMIGQLLVVGFQGVLLEDSNVLRIKEHIAQNHLGGVILFAYNIESPHQVTELLKDLQAANERTLFTLVDQEGGRVQRLSSKNGFEDFLSAKKLGSSRSIDEAYQHYLRMSEVLAHAGFNFNFGPCVDIDCDPPCPAIGAFERSYSDQSSSVVDYARTMVKAQESQGVWSCLKHFPGHGSAQADSHKGIVDITNYWQESELVPFAELVADGSAQAIMTAHVVHNEIDPDTPATLSKTWLGKLRADLGFGGVIVSDDLHMGAIQQHYTFEEIVEKGFNAGLDLFVFSNNPAAAQGVEGFEPDLDLPKRFIKVVQRLIESGKLTEQRVEQSYKRVCTLSESRVK